MTFESRVAALSAGQRASLAERLRRLGAALDDSEPAAGKRLVAYVAPRSGHAVDPVGLRGFLRARLPEPMVPSAFVVLDELPVTPSGKLDRRALPAPEAHGMPVSAAPTTPEEVALADLWAEVLGLDRVGVDDDFFALGGDSIRLLRLCGRAREMGIALTPRDLFESPTIAGLAARR
ncbi:MAG: phosphopantetheine-binding protein [Thermoanaerobaculia bacterium]